VSDRAASSSRLLRALRASSGVAFAVLLALPAAGLAQTAARRAVTFRGGVEVIRVSLSVTDHKQQLVTGLSEGDFALYEDGVRQELAYFSPEPLPLSVSLLIDCSSSMGKSNKLPVAQQAGSRFVELLRPEDVAQVVQFNDRVAVLQDFTSDHTALQAALRSTHASGATGLLNALYVTLKQLRRQGVPEAPRRRAIVVLSDGVDTTSLVDEDQVLELARQSDVAVYTVALLSLSQFERQRTWEKVSYFLSTLARVSGGEVSYPQTLRELDSIYGRVGEELRGQYTLGYVSRNERQDGRWRQILVRTPSRTKLQLRHRLGYYPFPG
jgi:Ca-activated chloride channel family protein